MSINLVRGPECPQCGCNDSEEISQTEWFGVIHCKLQCQNCFKLWMTKMEPEEPSIPIPQDGLTSLKTGVTLFNTGAAIRCSCPECGGENPKVTRTVPLVDRVLRYHNCQHCHKTFKSTEALA